MSAVVIWGVWDYERYESRDSEEPRLVAVCVGDKPAQAAHRACAVLNARRHPAAAMGYAYDYRAQEIAVPQALERWTDDEIIRIIDPDAPRP